MALPIRILSFVVVFLIAGAGAAAAATPPMKFGAVEIAAGTDGGRLWNPQAGTGIHVVVQGRLRPAQRGKTTAFVRYAPGRKRCGASYATGRGKPYGPFHNVRTDAKGYFSIRTGAKVRIATAGNVRFCVWLARGPGVSVKPVIQDIPFHAALFGASITATGTYWVSPIPWTSWYAVSSRSFVETESGNGCTGAALPVTSETHERVADTGFAVHAGGRGPVGSDTCNEVTTYAYRLLAGFANELDQGAFSLSASERRTRPAPIKHLGAGCVFDPALFASAADARAYIIAVGCHPGRTLRRASSDTEGMVTGFEIHGARARLASPGATVDIVVSDGPA